MITRCKKERSWINEKATLGINNSPTTLINVEKKIGQISRNIYIDVFEATLILA
jgi:hypothetical protein